MTQDLKSEKTLQQERKEKQDKEFENLTNNLTLTLLVLLGIIILCLFVRSVF